MTKTFGRHAADARARLRLGPHLVFAVVLWTIAVGCALWWAVRTEEEHLLDLARTQARELCETYRLFLKPAYMSKTIHEMERREPVRWGRVVSVNPVNAANGADWWEAECLHAFETGAPDRGTLEAVSGQPRFRYMVPLRAQEECLACHADQGYSKGSLMGGISVSVPLAPILSVTRPEARMVALRLGVLWAVGLLCMGISGRSLYKRTAESERSQMALRESEERYRTLFESSRDAIMTLEPPSWQFTSGNPACVAMFGAEDEDGFTSHGPWELSPEHQPDGRPSGEKAKEMIETAMREGSHFFEWTHQRLGGEEFPATVLLTRVQIGSHAFLQATVRDISRQKRLELGLNQAQKLEAVGRLAAGIAHEINTPTQYVGDNIEFLQIGYDGLVGLANAFHRMVETASADKLTSGMISEAKDLIANANLDYLAEQIPRAIGQSLEGVERISTIVQAMKEFSHPGATAKSHADLNQCIRSTVMVSRNEWKYVADLEMDLENTLPHVLCVAGEINQALLNVIVNAAHAIGDVVAGTEQKGKIEIRTRQDGDWAVIEVADTGSGIPEESREHIFDPFYTTKEVGRGTGQGLAIARNVVADKHGGTISVASEVGKGTTFTIRLPIDS